MKEKQLNELLYQALGNRVRRCSDLYDRGALR